MKDFNTRILVIDDDENVRQNFREILEPHDNRQDNSTQLRDTAAVLFNSAPQPSAGRLRRSSATFDFELDEAPNGKQGFQMVEQALRENRPYAAIFVDMRMPGWDGLETVRHLREIDAEAEIIFVTAYSDHSLDEIVTSVGTNISYHCKPFSTAEIEQIATKSVYEWNKTKNLEELIGNIANLRMQHWEMETLLHNILTQVAYLIGTHSALLAVKKGHRYEKILAIGNLCNDKSSQEYLHHIPEEITAEIYQNDDFAYFRIEEYGILAIFEKSGKPLNHERIYIVRLFLEQAALAIRNVDLQETISRQEKLSALGQAISMIVHDLRNSVGNIISLCELATNHIDDREFVGKMLKTIGESADDGLKMASDLLDFAGNKPLVKKSIYLPELMSVVTDRARTLPLPAAVKLNLGPVPEEEFMGDFSKMSRTLLNLIINAAEAMEAVATPNPEITVELQSTAKTITFRVRDNGPGISAEIRDRMFVPFATFGKSGGTGLGLAIAKRFVEDHGGKIIVASSPAGTEFTLAIPRGNPATTTAATATTAD
ncbi:MAG: ATP-binding protein [Victivallales bacterium]|nr:ATP-binding protein [Victivallales bacterium]